jgi:hypothetical protein
VLNILIAYLNEGVKIWFFVFKAIFLSVDIEQVYLLRKYKTKEQFILELAQRIDQKYKFNKNEFIYVSA